MTNKAKKQKAKNSLEDYFFCQITTNQQKDFLQSVTKACSISVPTFYKRLKKPSKFSNVEQKFIAELIQKPIETLFN